MGCSVKFDGGGGKDFEPVTDMIQAGVLADIVDKGEVPNKFKPGTMQHKVRFDWIVAEEDTEGRNKRVFETFTLSLNEKATLRKRLKELGLTDAKIAELKEAGSTDLDLDVYLGTKRMLVLSEEDASDNSGKKFVKVTATMPLKKGQTGPDIPKDFIRQQDKTEK